MQAPAFDTRVELGYSGTERCRIHAMAVVASATEATEATASLTALLKEWGDFMRACLKGLDGVAWYQH